LGVIDKAAMVDAAVGISNRSQKRRVCFSNNAVNSFYEERPEETEDEVGEKVKESRKKILFRECCVVYSPYRDISVLHFIYELFAFYFLIKRIPTDHMNFKIVFQIFTEFGKQLTCCFHIRIKRSVQEEKTF